MKSVLITGVLGGIGNGLAKTFKESGYFVIGLDVKDGASTYCDKFINFDINTYCNDPHYKKAKDQIFHSEIPRLNVLINNAAVQILDEMKDIKLQDWNHTLNVNLTGPMLLSQFFLSKLIEAKGSIINIASIHQQLTKKKFVTYATSKAALVGLTKSMSVDLQGCVRVNAISPAAIDTQMLRAGFDNDEDKINDLKEIHPSQRIGQPEEVARLALLLAEDQLGFINGANIQMDGGIGNVLKDLD